MKTLNNYELQALKELQNTIYQNQPLINLVQKNYCERGLSCEKIADILYQLNQDEKIKISKHTFSDTIQYDKLLVAHYEKLHKTK